MLRVILWKHFVVRTNKISSTILTILELLVPILTFLLIIYTKSELGTFDKVFVNESTYLRPISNEELLTRINIASTNILYTPDTEFVADLVREAQLKLNMYNENIKRFPTKEKLIDYYNTYDHEGPVVVIIFNNAGYKIPQHLDYEIKIYEEGILWHTDKLFSDVFTYVPGIGSESYLEKAFAAVQVALDTSFIEMASKSMFNTSLTYQEYPYPPHLNTDGVTTSFQYILPFITIITFIFICPITLKRIVLEKSSGLKELLKIAGVQSWTLWFGWFLNGIILNAISVIGIAIIITQPLFSGTYPVIEHCNVVVLMLFLLLYCSATIAFFLAFSVFFNKATLAMVLGVLFWIISYIVFVGVAANVEVMSITIKGIFLLFPTIALYYGYNTISLFEMREADITFYNLHESPTTSYDDLSLGFVMLMLAFDTVLYVTLAVYFDKIWPGPYGISKPWNFLLNKVWKMFRENEVVHKPEDYLLPSIEVANLKTIMQLRNVTKVYDNTVAVCDLTMDIYEGSITGLLGENGAGKSTTMSMLTGLTKATSGQIYIDSCAINENVDVARKNVAICTQHDLLYEELTVMDHLILFGMLKGKSRRRAREQATHLLEQTLKLDNKANKFVSELSGGMKRKLSLGIALMGDPKILILDEPTSGIDVEGRREIWDLILSFKGKKTVLISTHFLEEAEYLSDYIAIMGFGCLICFGTPIGLKKQYDIGYKCTITYQDTSKYPDIRKLLQKFTGFDSIDKKEDNTIQCRFKEGSKNEIIRLLHELDDAKGKCKLTYKLSSNTLEDVYLKVQDKGRTPRQIDHTETERTLPSSWVKIRIFMRKRSLFLQKKWMQYLCLFLLAFAVFLFTFTLGNTGYADVSKDGTKIRLDLSLYGRTDVYYRISGANQDPKLNEYYNNLVTSAGSSPNKVENVSETIIAKGLENIAHYMKRMIIAAEFVFDDDNRLSAVNVLHANKAYHGAPISINTAMNALLKYYAGKNYSISASYTPLHAHNQEKQALTQSEFSNLFLWLTLLPIGPLLLLSAVLLVPTVEYAKSTRSLDKLFGYGTCEHWLNNGAWDLIHYIISISVILLLIFVIPIHYLDAPSGGTLYLYLTMYGIFSIPFAYTFTFTKTVEGAYAKFLIIHIIGAPIMAGIFLALEAADAIANFAMWKTVVFVLEPHVSLCSALANFSIKMITNHNWDIMPVSKKQFLCSENFVQNPCCAAESKECAEYRRILDGDFLAHLAISFIIYASILIMRDCVGGLFSNDIFKRLLCCYKTESETNEGDYIFSVKDVSKEYTKLQLFGGNSYSSKHGLFSVTHALKNLTLQLDKGKCLGLLGVNGAGKTTSFRILTKQINPSGGNIKYPKGNSPTMGYCPQHNALLDEFTARELLHMYGTLRQIKNIEDVVKKLLDKFDLTLIADKPSGTYSGGSKRKLATCISIIGFPKCILLDEPTSGVDSVSRRELWDIIGQIKQRKESGIILTSHSMDECEELCDTLCILKDGDVEANSPIADLKRKYCVGHVLNIKLKSNGKRKHEGRSGEQSNSGWEETDQTDGSINITRYLIDIFERKNVTVLGTHNAVMHIKIINSEWATIFEEIEKMDKKVFNIDDYWVKEASLEEVLMQVGKSDNSLKKSNIV